MIVIQKMKYLLLISLLLISCIPNSQKISYSNFENNEYLDSISGVKMLQTDFLKFADTEIKDSLEIRIISSFAIYADEINRIVSIDAEELAEFNFDFFLPRLNEILAKRDFSLNVEKTENIEESFEVIINKRKVKLYRQSDIDQSKFWEVGSRIFFKTINELLAEQKIKEQFYLLYGGNDLHVMLLDKEHYLIMKERYADYPPEIPYLP